MLKTQVELSLAAVQLLRAELGAALRAVPHKDGEEDDGEDLEEEAQPGELEPRGDGALRHVVGCPGNVNPRKWRHEE